MKKFSLLLAAACVLFTGCHPSYRDTALYQSSGRPKSIVAVLPVINHTEDNSLSWDLSQEFTDEIRNRLYSSPRIYLHREGGSLEIAENFNQPNPAQITQSKLGGAEFVVVADLIKQNQTPTFSKATEVSKAREIGSTLEVALRLRVLDIREEKPKIVLQEVLTQEEFVTGAYSNSLYSKSPWGSTSFQNTPLGMAHNRLIRHAVARIEGYIEATR